jgi:hypothetical protein
MTSEVSLLRVNKQLTIVISILLLLETSLQNKIQQKMQEQIAEKFVQGQIWTFRKCNLDP